MQQLHKAIMFITCSAVLSVATTAYAEAPETLKCPNATDIQAVNLGEPTVWVAPPVENSRKEVGVGLGGKVVGDFIAAEPYKDSESDYYGAPSAGWYCIYETSNNYSLHTYENEIRKSAQSALNGYPESIQKSALKKLDNEFNKLEDSRQPFLKKYATRSVGFVRYRYPTSYFERNYSNNNGAGNKK